ncbi:MAG TPA: hypothetical protein PLC61_05190 [Chitinophagales bacterium]|nr:hypothetical protein [Chitinophagales bacterium]MCB9075095.1 hypothetical protein [Chitinophagales bacterium]HMU99215.1 hypothetical protein [Chitinophagales bacterium]HMV02917.1 hypothetical protein [Chitinophagales bacterium]HMY43158.1 hypothetical protein [Chitinophagales bacterium]
MDEIKYNYRKSILRHYVNYTLTKDGLLITSPDYKDRIIPYHEITSLRFEYLLNNRYDSNRYSCTIYTIDNKEYQILSTSYAGIANFENQAEPYVVFVKGLLAIVRKINPNSKIYLGQSKIKYFGNMVLLILVLLLLLSVMSYFPVSASFSIVFKLIMIVFFSFYMVLSFTKNYPRELEIGQEIDESVLPKIK